MITSPTDRIFVALDTPDATVAVGFAKQVSGLVGGIKLGKEFFVANGPDAVRAISGLGMPIFLDLKFHDIPNTVAGAVRSAMAVNPAVVNVHSGGGRDMMLAADAARKESGKETLLIGVTVLTSMSDDDLAEVGVTNSAEEQVVRLAKLTQDCGLDGVVCSPREIGPIRAECGPDFKLIVPGIRPSWAATGDQKRVMTPADAVRAGADYLVIGRPITGADNPAEAAQKIADELAGL